jgi:recombination protein RecA
MKEKVKEKMSTEKEAKLKDNTLDKLDKTYGKER